MKYKPTRPGVSSLVAGLCFFVSISLTNAQISTSGLRITIAGAPTSTDVNVTLSGQLSLLNATSDRRARIALDVPNVNGNFSAFGGNTGVGAPSTSAFQFRKPGGADGRGSGLDTAAFSIANGLVTKTSGRINNLVFSDAGGFGLILDGTADFTTAIDAGDILSVNGSFDMDISSLTTVTSLPPTVNFSTTFNLGTHTGTYNGQNVTVVVTNAVPEPSSMILATLSGLGLTLRRRRLS